jgi:aminopeptidase N
MRTVIRIVFFFWAGLPGFPDTYSRQPAVDAIHYEVSIELNEASDTISAATGVELRMREDRVSRVELDFAGMTVDSVTAGGTEAKYSRAGERLTVEFDSPLRRDESVTVQVRYHGRPGNTGLLIGKNALGRRVYFAENWPDRAHHWFPCIDHPSDKASADLTITADARYEVVGPGALVETRSALDGRKSTHWSETAPIPTYCMVFGAAEFLVRNAGVINGTPISWYVYPPDAPAAKAMFDRTGLAMQFFTTRIGTYPYEKLAQVEATTRIGGMENASAIFYAESSFRGSSPSERVVAHEMAHQWFGDSVTEADWDHLWLSEGFATYFEALFYEYLEGPESLKRSMSEAAQAVMTYHKTNPAAIIDPGTRDLMKKLNALNYQKGAWVLHMLRKVVGEEAFFRGIRKYYGLYAGTSILSGDFIRVMESVSGMPLDEFFRQWLYQPGWPEYSVSWSWNEEAAAVDLSVRQTQATGVYSMPVEIEFRYLNRRERHTLSISSTTHSVRIPADASPTALVFDPDGWILKSCTVNRRQGQ